MLNSHRKNDILNASRPTLFPLLFSHDLEFTYLNQNVLCVKYAKNASKILFAEKKSNFVHSIQLLMSLKNTSHTHIIQIDKDVTYLYLYYYNTIKPKKSLIIPPSEKTELWSIQKNPHIIDCHKWIIYIFSRKSFIILTPTSRKILPR